MRALLVEGLVQSGDPSVPRLVVAKNLKRLLRDDSYFENGPVATARLLSSSWPAIPNAPLLTMTVWSTAIRVCAWRGSERLSCLQMHGCCSRSGRSRVGGA